MQKLIISKESFVITCCDLSFTMVCSDRARIAERNSKKFHHLITKEAQCFECMLVSLKYFKTELDTRIKWLTN